MIQVQDTLEQIVNSYQKEKNLKGLPSNLKLFTITNDFNSDKSINSKVENFIELFQPTPTKYQTEKARLQAQAEAVGARGIGPRKKIKKH